MEKENDIPVNGAIAPPVEGKKAANGRPVKAVEATEAAGVAETAEAAGAVYSAAELAGAAQRQFKVLPEVAAAALKLAGRDMATIPEAEKIIRAFVKKAVT